jgi:hypothetical protein
VSVRIRLSVDGAEATAELDMARSPDAARAFSAVLPLEGELVTSAWSGHGCELLLPDALRAVTGSGATSVDVPVGTLAIVPATEGPLLVVPYGTVKAHTAIGPVAATLLAHFVDGQGAFLARIERTFDEGALAVRIVVEA